MLLYCPKCNTGYDIEPNLIPEKGMKMRCAKCGEVWRCSRDDLVMPPVEEEQKPQEKTEESETPPESPPQEDGAAETEEPSSAENAETKSPEDVAMSDIFARLSTQTEELFKQEKTIAAPRRMWSKGRHFLGLEHPENLKYYLLFLATAALLLLFAMRFELVRAFPAAAKVYDVFGIEARVVGEGLEFQNIIRNEYVEDYVRKLEIKGFIANTNPYEVEMPLIHVEVMDKDTNLLQSVNDQAPINSLEAGNRMAFRIVINQPSALAKYILLTFTKK